ncbi:MAG: extracellular solute-binding protein [Opitutaceae bacterium]|nr:extracellular solute-binding protein [Opitutaceae bacterium]
MWLRYLVLAALAVVLVVPFALRPRSSRVPDGAVELVIVSPHNEAIRHEFGAAFERWYRQQHGQAVSVSWRVIGGANEITRFLRSEYGTAFRNSWERRGREWNIAVESACMDERLVPDDSPGDDTEAEAARRAFLASSVGAGIDLFFGGGGFEFAREARAGRLVDSGVRQRHPEWFVETVIPSEWGGEPLGDPQGRWVGTVFSSYGILSNRDSLERLGVPAPSAWADLTNPRLLGEVALVDPTKSASVAKAYEMVIQQQIHLRLAALTATEPDAAKREARAVREGWIEGLRILQLAAANARYFTDSSQKPPIDVAQGDAAAGVCIDFYGRFQEEVLGRRDNGGRVRFVTPAGGSIYSTDPIALLRGAPHPELARAFVDFVLSLQGQSLWNLRVGTAGGPTRFALRRLPVRRDFYSDAALAEARSDPAVNPYDFADVMVYRPEWTGGLFRELSFVIRAVCMDAHPELVEAWRDAVAAGRPARAMAKLQDLSVVDYDRVCGEIRRRLASRDKLDGMRLDQELTEHFRRQYREAQELAAPRR